MECTGRFFIPVILSIELYASIYCFRLYLAYVGFFQPKPPSFCPGAVRSESQAS